jgi:hypothetical protein
MGGGGRRRCGDAILCRSDLRQTRPDLMRAGKARLML